jgi:methenyltetrahydromethanopterin cyclohydrolase
MGKTNDAVLFGGRTYYYVESEEGDDIAAVAAQLPSSAADGYVNHSLMYLKMPDLTSTKSIRECLLLQK